MFYRYEAKNRDGEFVGIFKVFNPYQRRYFNRFLKEPKWYANNPDVDSRCWFTEEGYNKYRGVIEELIAQLPRGVETRLRTVDKLDNVVAKGKIQCITLNLN